MSVERTTHPRTNIRGLDKSCAALRPMLMRYVHAVGALAGAAFLVLLLFLFPAAAQQQGFAGLGGEADGYARVTPNKDITFPKDHGAHPAYRIEWWYVTANLIDEAGNPLGVQFTLFRQAATPDTTGEEWARTQYWMGHTALTTADSHLHGESLARGGTGQAGVTATPFEAWIDDWIIASKNEDFAPLRLAASGKGFSYDLTLATDAPMVLQGEGGYSRKSDRGQASYYVSQPFFEVAGTVTIDGTSYKVTGGAWMDREWSSQPLAADQTGWDWFSLHLGTGEKVMLFRLRSTERAPYFAGNWISPDGTSQAIPADAINAEPLGISTVAGRSIPTSWRLTVEGHDLDVTVGALNPQSWNETLFPYWEGPITVAGSHEGVGYLEMTGYPGDR